MDRTDESAAGVGSLRREFTSGYPTLLSALGGVSLGLNGMLLYSFPHFTSSWQGEFGWNRFAMGGAISAAMVGLFLAGPLVGRLVDRWGSRRIIPIAILLLVTALLGLTLVRGSVLVLYLGYFMLGLMGAGTTSVSYARSVTSSFNAHRGVALGIFGCGPGLTAAILPLFLPEIIRDHGWRMGYITLAVLAIAAFPLALLLRDQPKSSVREVEGNVDSITTRQALRSRTFVLMSIGMVFGSTAFAGVILNFIPMVLELGAAQNSAEIAASVLGASTIAGRIFTGMVLDRIPARIVGPLVFLTAATSYAMLAMAGADYPALFAVLFGCSLGAGADLAPYMIARYFGIKAFSELLGWSFSVTLAGYLMGPALVAIVHGYQQSSWLLLLVWGLLNLIAAAAFALLKAYPHANPSTVAPA